MSHQIFNQIQKVKSAASKLSGAKSLNFSPDFQGEKRLVLNAEVKKLRRLIDDTRQEHSIIFDIQRPENLSAIDLMEMGY